MKKNKILFITPYQFGYWAGYTYYCEYLKRKYDVTFFCIDMGLPRKEANGFQVVYLVKTGNKLKDLFRFFLHSLQMILKQEYAISICVYFRLSWLLGLLTYFHKNVILDIRTGSICSCKWKRWFENRFFQMTSYCYHHVIILSDSLAKVLRIKRYHLLPLGGESLFFSEKNFTDLHFFYIGTLSQRRIPETVKAFELFCQKLSKEERERQSYTIIGKGSEHMKNELIEACNAVSCKSLIEVQFDKRHEDIKRFWNYCNVGIAFVPMIPAYDCQPATKIFEYALSGMYTIGTKTTENIKLLFEDNGLLCDDTPKALAEAMYAVYQKRSSLNSHKIFSSLEAYQWKTIIEKNMIPYFESIITRD